MIIFENKNLVFKENVTTFALSNKKSSEHAASGKDKENDHKNRPRDPHGLLRQPRHEERPARHVPVRGWRCVFQQRRTG